MNILFFDIFISGHHLEYINHIVDYLVENKQTKNSYFFIVHQNFIAENKHIYNKVEHLKNIDFIEIDTKFLKNLNVSNRFIRSLNNFNVVNKYAQDLKIDICYLLHMNVFQLALGLRKPTYKIRGILFMQFTNMKINSLKQYYYYLRRYLPILLCKNNKNIDSIFLLNDKESCVKLNNRFKKNNVFKFLPDPIPNIVPENITSLTSYYNVEADTVSFLHFGTISERKGIIEIINSTKLIDKQLQKKITILIVGKSSNPNLEKKIVNNINEVKKSTLVNIIWENKFVSEQKMTTLFKLCDYVLMPYKNPEASSGVLGHAIKASRPVIGPSTGLIGDLIHRYELGLRIENISASSIAEAIDNYEDILFNPLKSSIFLRNNTPDNFAKTLLCQ
jgi:glycosyltransferase involved in cell wall biosynthesis